MIVTAENLTDEQIRDFNKALGIEMADRDGATWRELADLRGECAFALGYQRGRKGYKAEARTRIAAAINYRAKERCPALRHRHSRHVEDVCDGLCCTACGGPIDSNEECRCEPSARAKGG